MPYIFIIGKKLGVRFIREKLIYWLLVVIVIFFLPIFITSVLTDIGEKKDETVEDQIKINYYNQEDKISLDEYLIGVVAAQIPAYFEEEALKAQGVIARTFTLKKLKENDNIVFTKDIQGYYSSSELENLWGVNDYTLYYSKIKDAIKSTDNLVITYKNELIDPLFHLVSTGTTRSAKEAWGQDIPYLQSIESIEDIRSPKYKNKYNFSLDEFAEILTNKYPDINFSQDIEKEIQIIERDKEEYVRLIQIGNKILNGEEFRKIVNIASSNFQIEFTNNEIGIVCKGYGHGVGLSQYGADNLGKEGKTYDEILEYYYKGIVLEENK